MATILNKFVKTVRDASKYNPDVQVPPVCILWPDKDRQWETVIPRLQNELSELFVLGDYQPDKQIGPAIWLRCVLAGKALFKEKASHPDEVSEKIEKFISTETIPIFYLPGVSRQDLRAVESSPDYLKPLAELQYRGVIWSQINAKDWTIFAFLKSDQGGLGLDVAQDKTALNAMQLVLYKLLDEDINHLTGKHLDKDYFNTLLTGGDPVRDVLQWLDQGEVFSTGRSENEWKGFIGVCKSQFAFHPEKDGPIAGAEKLAHHDGPWKAAWERFCEAPTLYPNIPILLRKIKMPDLELFSDEKSHGAWPQWNEKEEENLQKDLLALDSKPSHEVRKILLTHEKMHGKRRELVWSKLGEAPLANAMKWIVDLIAITENSLGAGSLEDVTSGYNQFGWKADDYVLKILNCVEKQSHLQAVNCAIRAIYLPWFESSAKHLQKLVEETNYPGGLKGSQSSETYDEGECVLFVDGLRFDVAKRLTAILLQTGFEVQVKDKWAALPSVTATGKPSVTPVIDKISGEDVNEDFEPCVTETGKSLKGGYHLKKLILDAGWTFLSKTEEGKGTGNAWCEFGDIDHEGHDRGWKLAKHIDGILNEIKDRIEQLIQAGWKKVRVVTDHGWLLFPGGLPKNDLPSVLTKTKWGRCAVLKPGALCDENTFPWFWNQVQQFVLSDGVGCFSKGKEYAHGGLSFQECYIPELHIFKEDSKGKDKLIEITDAVWKGMRCKIAIDGDEKDIFLDIRKEAANESSSIVLSVKPLKEDGTSSVVIDDDDLVGEDAVIVLLNKDGQIVAQEFTVIGGGNE